VVSSENVSESPRLGEAGVLDKSFLKREAALRGVSLENAFHKTGSERKRKQENSIRHRFNTVRHKQGTKSQQSPYKKGGLLFSSGCQKKELQCSYNLIDNISNSNCKATTQDTETVQFK
jgi:hypothetical protein